MKHNYGILFTKEAAVEILKYAMAFTRGDNSPEAKKLVKTIIKNGKAWFGEDCFDEWI